MVWKQILIYSSGSDTIPSGFIGWTKPTPQAPPSHHVAKSQKLRIHTAGICDVGLSSNWMEKPVSTVTHRLCVRMPYECTLCVWSMLGEVRVGMEVWMEVDPCARDGPFSCSPDVALIKHRIVAYASSNLSRSVICFECECGVNECARKYPSVYFIYTNILLN